MENKEFERIMNSLNSYIDDRRDIIAPKIASSEEYNKKYEKYSKKRDELHKKVSNKLIEEFENTIFMYKEIEEDYLYIQGLVDGILLKKQIYNEDK